MKVIRWIACFLLFFTSLAMYGQGFGTFSRHTVTVNRLLPATVNLNGKKIRIEAKAEPSIQEGDGLKSLLRTKLITLIQKDPRFILDEGAPQTILRFTITTFYIENYTITDTKGGISHSYRGKIEVAYQAMDVDTGAALDSENLVHVAGYEVAPSSPAPSWSDVWHGSKRDNKRAAAESSANETRDQLMDGIVASMAKRVAPTEEPFDAFLPGRALEPLSALALNHRWGALEEQAQAMPKLARPEDDTYRVYLVALAKEAQAYDLAREANERDQGKRKDLSAQDAEAEFRRAQRYMDEAGSLYKEIVTANSREKEFRPGDARTEQAIAIYATIARYKEEYQKAVVANQAKKQLERNSSAAAASSVVTPLNQVLDFCNRGMEADIIKEYLLSPDFIHDARATGYHFNFAKDSVSISDACKANASVIIKLMRERLGAVTPASQRKK